MTLYNPVINVVFKRDGIVAADQFKKLSQIKDEDGNSIIGNIEGTFLVAAMEEAAYKDNTEIDLFKDKIIFVGDVKRMKDIEYVAEKKFDKYGVSYGVAGGQAYLRADKNVLLRNKALYNEFWEELCCCTNKNYEQACVGIQLLGKSSLWGFRLISKSSKEILRQQYVYGVTKFFENELNQFLTA